MQKTVARLCTGAFLSGYYTNHSLRATSATRLFEAGIDKQLIMQRTGHSTTTAVRSYKCTGEKLRAVTSDVLNAPKKQKGEAVEVKELPSSKQAVDPLKERSLEDQKENHYVVPPGFGGVSFAGASNFTVHFNYGK